MNGEIKRLIEYSHTKEFKREMEEMPQKIKKLSIQEQWWLGNIMEKTFRYKNHLNEYEKKELIRLMDKMEIEEEINKN